MDIKLFALDTTFDWSEGLANYLSLPLSQLEREIFLDGEHKLRSIEKVSGKDVFVVQSLFNDGLNLHDKLCRLLFFVGSLKDASAKRINVVLPYLAYARKDRKTKPNDSLNLKYIAQLLENMGANSILTLDVHNIAAYQNAFRIPTYHLESHSLFANYLVTYTQDEEIVIVSPDPGGIKRSLKLKECLEQLLQHPVGKAFLDKERHALGVRLNEGVVGQVKGKVAVIIDDIISSGKTIKLAIETLGQEGAKKIIVCATHGLMLGDASEILSHPLLDKLILTNSISPCPVHNNFHNQKLMLLDATHLFAKAIQIIHEEETSDINEVIL